MMVHIKFRLRLQSAYTHKCLGQCVFIHNWSSLPIKNDMLRKWLLLSPHHFLKCRIFISLHREKEAFDETIPYFFEPLSCFMYNRIVIRLPCCIDELNAKSVGHIQAVRTLNSPSNLCMLYSTSRNQ